MICATHGTHRPNRCCLECHAENVIAERVLLHEEATVSILKTVMGSSSPGYAVPGPDPAAKAIRRRDAVLIASDAAWPGG